MRGLSRVRVIYVWWKNNRHGNRNRGCVVVIVVDGKEYRVRPGVRRMEWEWEG